MYRWTGHRSQYNREHGSYGTDGKATDHNILDCMTFTILADRPQITI